MPGFNPFGTIAGPGPGGRTVSTLDNYRTANGMVFKDAYGERLYDTFRVVSGTVLPTNQFSFFSTPLGQQQAGLNFATQYAKSLIDTNLQQASQIQKGRYFEVISMQVRVIDTGAISTAFGSSGPGTQLVTSPAGAAPVSGAQEEKTILESLIVTYSQDNRTYESGKAIHFPSPYGMSGFAGAGLPGGSGAGTDAFAVVNNGFGRFYRFPVIRAIDGLRQFNVIAQFGYAWTPVNNFNIEVCLEGLMWRPVV
jgi:hypothetical protein